MQHMKLIELTDLHKSYADGENRRNHLLRGINLTVNRGEFIAIQGASGSGKTTLLSILGTLQLPDSGSYQLEGEELCVAGADHAQTRNKRIGFVFQDHRLLPQFTVWENILLPTVATSLVASAEQCAYARQLMELMNISTLTNQYPNTLSGGEAGRVAACRALVMKPSLLLADEPTGQLDAQNARNLAHLLSEVCQKLQTTIIMATHSAETAAVAHRVLTLKEGLLQ